VKYTLELEARVRALDGELAALSRAAEAAAVRAAAAAAAAAEADGRAAGLQRALAHVGAANQALAAEVLELQRALGLPEQLPALVAAAAVTQAGPPGAAVAAGALAGGGAGLKQEPLLGEEEGDVEMLAELLGAGGAPSPLAGDQDATASAGGAAHAAPGHQRHVTWGSGGGGGGGGGCGALGTAAALAPAMSDPPAVPTAGAQATPSWRGLAGAPGSGGSGGAHTPTSGSAAPPACVGAGAPAPLLGLLSRGGGGGSGGGGLPQYAAAPLRPSPHHQRSASAGSLPAGFACNPSALFSPASFGGFAGESPPGGPGAAPPAAAAVGLAPVNFLVTTGGPPGALAPALGPGPGAPPAPAPFPGA
jgi:hypothetical protein